MEPRVPYAGRLEREECALLPELLEGGDRTVTALLALRGQPVSLITVKGTVEMLLSPWQVLVFNSRSQSIVTSSGQLLVPKG